jgi:hypothetical protein
LYRYQEVDIEGIDIPVAPEPVPEPLPEASFAQLLAGGVGNIAGAALPFGDEEG